MELICNRRKFRIVEGSVGSQQRIVDFEADKTVRISTALDGAGESKINQIVTVTRTSSGWGWGV